MISQDGALVGGTLRRAGFGHWHIFRYRPMGFPTVRAEAYRVLGCMETVVSRRNAIPKELAGCVKYLTRTNEIRLTGGRRGQLPDHFAARVAAYGPSRRLHSSAQVRCWSKRT